MQASDLEFFLGPLLASLVALILLPIRAAILRFVLYLFNAIWILIWNVFALSCGSWFTLDRLFEPRLYPPGDKPSLFCGANLLGDLKYVPFWYACFTYAVLFFIFSAGWQWLKVYRATEAFE